MSAPKVVVHRSKEWTVDQPVQDILTALPMRIALLGPSGSGKTQLIQSMIIDMYRTKSGKSCFFAHLHDITVNARRPGLDTRQEIM